MLQVFDESFNFFVATFALMINFLIVCVHSVKTYQDLCTKERRSVSHRRRNPEKTNKYKLSSYMTITSIWSQFIANILFVMHRLVNKNIEIHAFYYCPQANNAQNQKTILFLSLLLFHCAKIFLYIDRILSYYMVYEDTIYMIRTKYISLIFSTIFFSWAFFIWCECWFVFQYDQKSNALISMNSFIVIVFTYDILMHVVCCYMFTIPIKNIIKSISSENDDDENNTNNIEIGRTKVEQKLMRVGEQIYLLTICYCTSSILIIYIYLITSNKNEYINYNYGCGVLVLSIDFIISNASMVMMKAYYPDKYYYQTACAFCIQCCDKQKYFAAPTDGKFEPKPGLEVEKEPNRQNSITSELSFQSQTQTEETISYAVDAPVYNMKNIPTYN